jgi:hypothetical protein
MRVRKSSNSKIKLPWIMIPVSIKARAVSCDHALAVGARVCNTAN